MPEPERITTSHDVTAAYALDTVPLLAARVRNLLSWGRRISLRVGSLCSGYGGLEMGAERVFGPLEHVWHAEIDPAASAVLAARWPGVPNLGDITAVTATGGWGGLAPVDVLLAGYPCQGESNAGLRKGADDPRFRWPDVHAAIRTLRPGLVVLENVRGHLNRSFPRVVADLAGIGYVGRWRCVRASDIGAAHRRERLFAVAWPADAAPPSQLPGTVAELHDGGLTLLPTPEASDGSGGRVAAEVGGSRPSGAKRAVTLGTAVAHLLPTPRAGDGRRGINPVENPANAGRGGPSLVDTLALLPTPSARDATAGRSEGAAFNSGWTLSDVAFAERWGAYSAAIARWEAVIGRPAPEPTVEGRRGSRLLSPLFVEWLMGLPAGWVTDIVDHRGSALRVLGNGVVPPAAEHTLRLLLSEAGRVEAGGAA